MSQNVSSGVTVLVVEDDELVRMGIMDALAECGLMPLGARDAAEALAILEAGAPLALLVTDIGLPDMDGRQLADLARAARPGLRILFLTGYRVDALQAVHGVRFVEKPIELPVLASIALSMIEGA